MRSMRMLGVALACTAPLLLVACGGGDSNGVTDPNPAPRYPAVGGRWEGQWTAYGIDTPATLELDQSQDRVQGTLTVGTHVNQIAGTVSEFGVLQFQGQPPSGCISYSTASPHLGLEERNTAMEGPLQRSSPNLGGPCGSGPLLQEDGALGLAKVS